MPVPHPPEFRHRAAELARLREKPVSEIAADLGISESCLRNWVKQADLDEGRRDDGLTTAEREELVQLRRDLKVARMEKDSTAPRTSDPSHPMTPTSKPSTPDATTPSPSPGTSRTPSG